MYDLHDSLVGLNDSLLKHLQTGAFHVGVEIHSIEYMYCGSASLPGSSLPGKKDVEQDDPNASGTVAHLPRQHATHVFRESVKIGETKCSFSEVSDIVDNMGKQRWTRGQYHVVWHNCAHFAAELADALGIGRIPDDLLGVAVAIDGVAKRAGSVISQMRGGLFGGSWLNTNSMICCTPATSNQDQMPDVLQADGVLEEILESDDKDCGNHVVFPGGPVPVRRAPGFKSRDKSLASLANETPSESEPSSGNSPGTNASFNKPPGTNSPGTNASSNKAPDTNAPGTNASSNKPRTSITAL